MDASVVHFPTRASTPSSSLRRPTGSRPWTSTTRRRTTTSRPPTTYTSRTRTRHCSGSRSTRSRPRAPSPIPTRSHPNGSTRSTSRHWPTSSPATRGPGHPTTCASAWGPTSRTTPTSAGAAPGGGRSLIRHLTDQGATLEELEQAGLVSFRERNDGTTYYRDFFRDRLIMPIRDPHDPAGEAILGFLGAQPH